MTKFSINTEDWTIYLSEARKIEPNIKVNQILSVGMAIDPTHGNIVNVSVKVIPDEGVTQ